MPTYAPSITINATPPLSITGAGGVSYEEILNSLGDFNFMVEEIFLSAVTISQILQNLSFNKFDSTGTQDIQQIVPNVDPYQRISSIYIDTAGKKIILDGRSSMAFDVGAGEIMTMILYCRQKDVRQKLKKFSKENAAQDEIKD